MEEAVKYNKKGDVWVVPHGSALHVSNFWSLHPGGELTILTFAGKDAATELDIIHPSDVVEKYAPDAIIGAFEDGGEEDDEENDSSEGGYTMEEAVKHNKKDDVWVVLGLLVPASWRRVGNPNFYWGGQYNRVRHAPPS